MASPEAEALKSAMVAMRENNPPGSVSLADRREGAKIMRILASEPAGVTETIVDAGGVNAMWVNPQPDASSRPDHVLMYFHGGGYIVGSAHAYGRFAGHLANRIGCRVLNVDYRLAPEHRFPAQVEDTLAAYRWLLDQGYAPGNIGLAGDSAGGGLVVSTLLAIRDADLKQPACAVPLSPWTDLTVSGDSMSTNAEADKLVIPSSLSDTVAMFLGDASITEPLASPLHADLASLAPMYVQVGADEVLLDDSLRLVEAVKAAGGTAEVEVFPEMQHSFQCSVGQIPEATAATDKIASYVKEKFDA